MPEPSAAWNRPYRKQESCVALDAGLTADPPVLYADGEPVGRGYSVPRSPRWNPRTTVHSSCAHQPGAVRIDLTETLVLQDGSGLYFHKGGQGYDPPSVPYGYLDAGALRSPPPAAVFSQAELDARGAEPRGRDGHGAGRENGPGVASSRVGPRPIGLADPEHACLYKDPSHYRGQTLSGARYSKYGDAGGGQGAGDRSFAYLCWSWLRQSGTSGDPRLEVSGGGAVRTLLKPGQLVHRCDVESIDAPAWDRRGNHVGRVV